MQLPLETVMDGVVRALTDTVVPAVSGPARAQLWAAIDVLRNLRDRIEERTDLLDAEATSAAAALARIEAALVEEGAAAEAARLGAALAVAPASPPAARAVALRAALVVAVEVLAALPPERAAAARGALGEHLVGQAMRDVAPLKPSLLTEISRG
jgi:hypothetical protein